MFSWGHLDQRVLQGSLARGLLQKPDLVEALSADAAAEVGVELMGWAKGVSRVRNRLLMTPDLLRMTDKM